MPPFRTLIIVSLLLAQPAIAPNFSSRLSQVSEFDREALQCELVQAFKPNKSRTVWVNQVEGDALLNDRLNPGWIAPASPNWGGPGYPLYQAYGMAINSGEMFGDQSDMWYGFITYWVTQNRTGELPPPIVLEGDYKHNRILLDRLRLPIRNFRRITLTPTWDPQMGYTIEMAGDPTMHHPARSYLIAVGHGQWLKPITDGRFGFVQGTLGHLLEGQGPVELKRLNKDYSTYYGGDAKVRQLELAELPSTGYRIRITLPSTVKPDKIRWRLDGQTFAGPIKRVFIYDSATGAFLATVVLDMSTTPHPQITTVAGRVRTTQVQTTGYKTRPVQLAEGQALRELRKVLGLTQSEMGEQLGLKTSKDVAGTQVSQWELGVKRIPDSIWGRILRLGGFKIDTDRTWSMRQAA